MTKLTVTELVRNFATACRALVPALETAEVPWRDEAKYDNWDRVSEPLFVSLVTEPCAYQAAGEVGLSKLKVAAYDFHEVAPGCNAYIALDGDPPRRMIGLSSVGEPFDHVIVAGTAEVELVPLSDASFVFIIESPEPQMIREVDLAAK